MNKLTMLRKHLAFDLEAVEKSLLKEIYYASEKDFKEGYIKALKHTLAMIDIVNPPGDTHEKK